MEKTSVAVVDYVFDFGLVGDQLPRYVPEQSKQNIKAKQKTQVIGEASYTSMHYAYFS